MSGACQGWASCSLPTSAPGLLGPSASAKQLMAQQPSACLPCSGQGPVRSQTATSSCPAQPVEIPLGAGKGGGATHMESLIVHQEQSWVSGSASLFSGPTSQPFASYASCRGPPSCVPCGSSVTETNSVILQATSVDGDSPAGCPGREAQPGGPQHLPLHQHPPSFTPFRLCSSISCDGSSSPAHAGTALGSSSRSAAPTRPPRPWSPSAPVPGDGPSPAAHALEDANGPAADIAEAAADAVNAAGAADLMDLDGRCPTELHGASPGLWAGAGTAGDQQEGCLELQEDSLDMEGVASLPEELTRSLELAMMQSLTDCEEQGQQQQQEQQATCSSYGLGGDATGSIHAEHMVDGSPFAVVNSGCGAGPNSVSSGAPTSDSLTTGGAKEPSTRQCSSVPGGSSGTGGGDGGGGGASGSGGGAGGSGTTGSTARGRRQQASASWAQGDSGQESEGSDDAKGGTAAAVRPDGLLKVPPSVQVTVAVRIKLPNGPPGAGGKRGSKRSGGGAAAALVAATLAAAAGSSSVPAPTSSGDAGAEAAAAAVAAAAAAGEDAAGAVASGLARGTPARCYAPGAIVGTFLPELYLTGGDCILVGTTIMGRSKFEKLGGSPMAKWYRSIRTYPDLEPLGRWLQRHRLPILKGKARNARRGRNTAGGDSDGVAILGSVGV